MVKIYRYQVAYSCYSVYNYNYSYNYNYNYDNSYNYCYNYNYRCNAINGILTERSLLSWHAV